MGNSRPNIPNSNPDIGAYESRLVTPILDLARWDINGDGILNMLDVLAIGQYFGEITEMATKSSPDVNGDGQINVLDIILLCTNPIDVRK